MKFGNLKLYKNRPTIIAEVGVNHECKYKNVYKLINDAKIGGADAIKFQTYKVEKIVSKKALLIGILQKKKLSLNTIYLKSTINLIIKITKI